MRFDGENLSAASMMNNATYTCVSATNLGVDSE